jgi:hypothetical protein
VKNLCLFVTAFKDLYVSWVPKNPIVIPQAASSTGPGHVLSCGIPKVYSSTLKLLQYSFNVGFTVFFCLSSRSVNEERGSLFRLGEVEPSFKEFLNCTARMRFQVLRNFLLLQK